MRTKNLLIPLILCAALTGCQSSPVESPDSTSSKAESSAPETTSSPMTTTPETTISDTTISDTTIPESTEPQPESAEPVVVNSSDGRFTATIASPSSDLIVTDNETKKSITAFVTSLGDADDTHVPRSPRFFGDKLWFTVIGYEWFEGIGVCDCSTQETVFYPTKTGNSPILISDDAILTVDKGHGSWIYTVYKAALDGQINETPIASVQGDIRSCSLDGGTLTINIVDGSTKVAIISDAEPMLSRDLSDIMAKLGEKYPDFGVRKSLKSMTLTDDLLKVSWQLESCDVAAEINILTGELISSETDASGSQDKPKSSELTSPDGRFTAYQNDDSDLYLTDNQTGNSILVEKADISNDAQLARKPVPACFADGTLYFNVFGYEGFRALGVYDCLTGEKTLCTIAPDHYPVYVGADAIFTSNYDYGEVPKEYFRVELGDGKAVETSVSSGKLPNVIPEWYAFDPSTLRVGLFLDDVLWIYDLNDTVAPVEVSSLSAKEREMTDLYKRQAADSASNPRFAPQTIDYDLYVLDKETNESKLVYKCNRAFDAVDYRQPEFAGFTGDKIWFNIAGLNQTANGFGVYDCLTGELQTFDTQTRIFSVSDSAVYSFSDYDGEFNIYKVTQDGGFKETPLIDHEVFGYIHPYPTWVFDADSLTLYYLNYNSGFFIADLSSGTQRSWSLGRVNGSAAEYIYIEDDCVLITSTAGDFVWRVKL